MKKMTKAQIEKKMASFEGWEYGENAIHTSLEFADFKDAFAVMVRIAFEAEKLQHHPDWSNVYNVLNITLSTHEAGGVTEKDFEMAAIIDQLVS